ncbi:hypothetical protein N9948_00235 [bacterium]|nr:hypothetical protein [bacterium]
MSKARLYKKYRNNKIYDTQEGHYVSLGEIVKVIEEGIPIQIIVPKDNEDITYLVLLQALYEKEVGNHKNKDSSVFRINKLERIERIIKEKKSFLDFIKNN